LFDKFEFCCVLTRILGEKLNNIKILQFSTKLITLLPQVAQNFVLYKISNFKKIYFRDPEKWYSFKIEKNRMFQIKKSRQIETLLLSQKCLNMHFQVQKVTKSPLYPGRENNDLSRQSEKCSFHIGTTYWE
jgi:hypothetical protein